MRTASAHPTSNDRQSDPVIVLEQELPARLFRDPDRHLREWRARDVGGNHSLAPSIAASAGLQGVGEELVAKRIEIEKGEAFEIILTTRKESIAVLVLFDAGTTDSRGAGTASRLRYLFAHAARDVAGEVREVLPDGTVRSLGVQATTETLRTWPRPDHGLGEARQLTSGQVTVNYAFDANPDFGPRCVGCGRDVGGKRRVLYAKKGLTAAVFQRHVRIGMSWCPRCRWRSVGRWAAALLSGACTAFIGAYCAKRFGWSPTGQSSRKLMLLLSGFPGFLVAYLTWGDPDPPFEIKQAGDRFTLTFDLHRVASEFRKANPLIFRGSDGRT